MSISIVRETLRVSTTPSIAALHEERLLRVLVELARDKSLERGNGLLELHILALDARELLGHRERLRHEALNSARAAHDELVLFRELVHAEDRDDVLELLVALQNALHVGCYLIVAVADELRVEDSRRRSERIDGGIDAELRDRARQHDRRVEVRKGGRRRRIGDVVGGNVDRLHRVIDPFCVDVMRSCRSPISVASVG